MKTKLILFILSLGLLFFTSVTGGGGVLTAQRPVCDTLDGLVYYHAAGVDEMPRFGGGRGLPVVYILQRFEYPEGTEEPQTRFNLRFIVNDRGEVIAPGIHNKSPEEHTPAENALLEIVSGMPVWTPGRLNGDSVAVMIYMPLNIRIESRRSPE